MTAVIRIVEEFLSSWQYFQEMYLAGWALAVLLPLVGVMVVARDQIFLGAAVAEASTLGVAVGLWLASAGPLAGEAWGESHAFLAGLAVLFSVLAALVASGTSRWGAAEAVTGWVFLAAGSLAVLVISHSPHGMEEVHRLVLSSIIGSSLGEVLVFAALALAVAAGAACCRRRILLILTDQEMASALGVRVRAWNLGLSCLLGLTVGLSLRASGLLYTFGCLVLPGLAARNLCRSALSVFAVAPAVGLATSAVAFVLAHHLDQPPGQMAVALLCGVAALAAGWRRVFPRA
ncbi:MAG: metal ABC transporter permease [Planctomycetes bacterium]|nr:metal ABC transporter permease [Planctomycetota bacterium]